MKVLKNIFGSVGRFILYILEFLLIIYVICITTFLLFRNKYGYTEVNKLTFVPIKIDTAELIKDGKSGNLLIVKNTDNIKEGDLIYYYTIQNEHYVVKSDYVKSIFDAQGTRLYTLDDGRKSTVVSTRVLGKYANQYAVFGTLYSILTSKYGFLILVLLPIMILFIYQLYSLIMVLKFEKVEPDTVVKKQESKKEDIEVL